MAVPSNISQIIAGTAEAAQTPDSNYTSKQVTIPRYEGSRMESADYNFFTEGDSIGNKLGKVAVVDKNPIYFAHFKSSTSPLTRFGTTKFNIDSLIEVPFEPILGKNVNPKTIQINGDNENLYEIVSTFEQGRKLSIYYNTDFFNGVDYSTLKTGSFTIFNPGTELKGISGNQYSPVNTSPSWSYSRFDVITDGIDTQNNQLLLLRTGSGFLELFGTGSDFNGQILFTDTVTNTAQKQAQGAGYMGYTGPYLAILHTYNYCLANDIIYDPSEYIGGGLYPRPIGVPSSLDSGSDFNYFKWLPSQSLLGQYEDFQEPFLVERGDIVRVSYVTEGTSSIPQKSIVQDFTVTEVASSTYAASTFEANLFEYLSDTGSFAPGSQTVKLFNKLYVTPDPSALSNLIPTGSISAFTVVKRENSDDRVIVNTRIPSGSNGNLTPSGEGFIVPNDMTTTQKRNVLTMINQLKSQNTLLGD